MVCIEVLFLQRNCESVPTSFSGVPSTPELRFLNQLYNSKTVLPQSLKSEKPWPSLGAGGLILLLPSTLLFLSSPDYTGYSVLAPGTKPLLTPQM